MAHFEIIVQRSNGQPRKNIRVSVFETFGKADEGRTDGDGKVVLSANEGHVKLFVEGHEEGKIGPGRHLVTTDR